MMQQRIHAIHPHWTGFLVLGGDGLVTHELTGNTGRYERHGDRLTVAWELFDPENYVQVADCYVQETLVGKFPDMAKLSLLDYRGLTIRATRLSVLVPGSDYEITFRITGSDMLIFDQIFVNHEYESPNLPARVESILDLGANIGLASVYFAQRYPQARILAIEPEADNFALLRTNTAALGRQVSILQAAVWKEDGTVNLHTEDKAGLSLDSWGVQVSDIAAPASAKTSCFRLETLLKIAGFETLDILKVDIEGAELELFAHGAEAWLSKVRLIIVETHERFRPGSDAAVRQALAGQFEELPPQGENLFFRRLALA